MLAIVLLDGPDCGSKGQVGIDRVGYIHRNAHRRCANQIGDICIEGLDDGRLPYGQFAVVIVPEVRLKSCLQFPTKPLQINQINTTIPKSEAESWLAKFADLE